MNRIIFNTIMFTPDGVYEVFEADYEKNTVTGRKCRPNPDENPVGTFKVNDVQFYVLRTRECSNALI